ncbi:MAG: cobalamin-dependent protein [Proteobacteria bacterium]|nr:cobalamin-dependent protein [Pseudomonadota bacterium]
MSDFDSQEALLTALSETILHHDDEKMEHLLNAVVKEGVSPEKIKQKLIIGLESAKSRIMTNHLSMAEFLVCLDTAIHGLENVALSGSRENETQKNNRIVIGVVKGDPHDLGKTIIESVYRAYGYTIFDMGSNVSVEKFLKGIEQHQATILAISAMMSTSTVNVEPIIHEAKKRFPHIAAIVGGAYMNEKLATSYGADAYSENALTVIENTETIMNNGR